MAEQTNHHYVPQYYFKLFNGGRRQICALLTKNGQVVTNAPIKGQSSRRMFYGTIEIEKAFSQLEGHHARALSTLVEVATTGDRSKWSSEQFLRLLQAVAFQRARTMLEVEKEAPAMQAMVTHMFSEWVRRTKTAEKASEILGPIEQGKVIITQSDTATVLRQISVAMESVPLLADLRLCVIRNHTDYPFIFSDSPVVFYNSYYSKITSRGVLGFQTPGLQVFLPLTSRLQLMMFDAAVYEGACLSGPYCDVVDRSDVSQLNALQLRHSRQAVYFGSPDDAEYAKTLYHAHRPCLVKPETVFRVRNDLRVSGEPSNSEMMHSFEPQIPYNLSLSFINCTPVNPDEYAFRHRCPVLVKEHRRLYPR